MVAIPNIQQEEETHEVYTISEEQITYTYNHELKRLHINDNVRILVGPFCFSETVDESATDIYYCNPTTFTLSYLNEGERVELPFDYCARIFALNQVENEQLRKIALFLIVWKSMNLTIKPEQNIYSFKIQPLPLEDLERAENIDIQL